MSISSAILLLFILIIVLVNTRQFQSLGIETSKVIDIEVPAISAIHHLDSLIYQRTILRNKISSSTVSDQESLRKQYRELSLQMIEIHQSITVLMKDYARLEMPSRKQRWKRLQEDHQKKLQASMDNIAAINNQHNELIEQEFSAINADRQEEANKLEAELISQETILHQELNTLSIAALGGVSSSGNKIHNIEYGARQMTYFLLFWFYLIGIVVSFFIIRIPPDF